MITITLSGGVYDGKVLEISEEIFNRGYLEMYAPLPDDIDLMAGCHDIDILIYQHLDLNPYVWRTI